MYPLPPYPQNVANLPGFFYPFLTCLETCPTALYCHTLQYTTCLETCPTALHCITDTRYSERLSDAAEKFTRQNWLPDLYYFKPIYPPHKQGFWAIRIYLYRWKISFLPTFPETNESNIEEVELTKELLWDEAEHSDCAEEEEKKKKNHSKDHLCNAN